MGSGRGRAGRRERVVGNRGLMWGNVDEGEVELRSS